jgi:hypothetical protein
MVGDQHLALSSPSNKLPRSVGPRYQDKNQAKRQANVPPHRTIAVMN